MKITPLDIRKQEFRKVIRGYDVMEVDTFLEMVADEYESILKSKSEWNSKIKQLEEKLKEYQEIEKTLQKTLMDAQNSMDKSKEDSKKEAELIIKEAELNANKIVEDARRELAKLKNEIMLLKAQKESFAIRLKHILNSQIELIKILELDDQEIEGFKKGVGKNVNAINEKLVQPEKPNVQKQSIYKQSKPANDIEKAKKVEDTEEGSLFEVVGSKGHKETNGDENLIEKMMLDIENEEMNKEKKIKKDKKDDSVRDNKGGKDVT